MTPRRVRASFMLLTFLQSLAVGFPMGLIVLFVQGRGIDLLQVGVLIAIQSATVVLLELPTGGLADVWGRKRVLLLSFAAGALSSGIALAAFSFPVFAAAMILSGFSRALHSGTAEAMFVDALQEVEPEADLQQGFSLVMTAGGLGIAIGALAGGFVPSFFSGLPAEGTAIFTPLAMPVACALGLWLLTCVGTTFLLHEPVRTSPPAELEGVRAIALIVRQSIQFGLKDRLTLTLISAISMTSLAFLAIEVYWQPHFADLQDAAQPDTRAFGAIFAVTLFLAAGGSALAGLFGRLTGRRYALANALVTGLLGVAILIFAAQTAFSFALVGFWLVHLAYGVTQPTFQALFNSAIPADKRATLISFQSLTTRAGMLVGGLGLGFLASRFSIPWAFRASAATLLAVVPLYLYAASLPSRSPASPRPGPGAPAEAGAGAVLHD